MMMNKYYTPVNQNEIQLYKFDSFEYYCRFFLLKKKKKSKHKIGGSPDTNKAAFYFEQNSKLDALLEKYFARMNSPPNFSEYNELYSKINDETEQYIKENEKSLSSASKEVIYCIKKIIRIKEKVDLYNTHFFSNSINIIVFIRSQLNQFFESKPNIIINPNLNFSEDEKISNDKDQPNHKTKKNKKALDDDTINYDYNEADFDVECPVEVLESYFENEFKKSPLIQKAPLKIISLCTYIQKHLRSRFQQIAIEDITQTIKAMSCIYDPELLYIIPNIVDDFITSYVQDITPNDYADLKNTAVQIMAGNFYNTLHHIGPMHKVTITPTKTTSSGASTPCGLNNKNDTSSPHSTEKIKSDDKKDDNDDDDEDEDEDSSSSNTSSMDSISTYSVDDSKGDSTESKSVTGMNDALSEKIASKHAVQDQNYNKISFAPLRKFISKYCKLFKIKYHQPTDENSRSRRRKSKNGNQIVYIPTNERMVLRCSFVRFLCNVIYTNFPGFLFEPINNKFYEACEIVRVSTPKSMEINPKIICDYMIDTSFVFLVESDTLYTNSPDNNPKKRKRSKTFHVINDKDVDLKKENELKLASNLINETQFLTNPIDIINNIFCALNYIKEFFQKCMIFRKYGSLDWKDTMKDKVKEIKNEMDSNFLAFDDIFPLLCMVISYAAPSNAVAVSDFLHRTEDLKLGSQFDFAKLLFTSAVQYITNDVLNDIKKSENQK